MLRLKCANFKALWKNYNVHAMQSPFLHALFDTNAASLWKASRALVLSLFRLFPIERSLTTTHHYTVIFRSRVLFFLLSSRFLDLETSQARDAYIFFPFVFADMRISNSRRCVADWFGCSALCPFSFSSKHLTFDRWQF